MRFIKKYKFHLAVITLDELFMFATCPSSESNLTDSTLKFITSLRNSCYVSRHATLLTPNSSYDAMELPTQSHSLVEQFTKISLNSFFSAI